MRKRLLRALALAVVPIFGALLVRLLYLSNKKRFHLPDTVPEEPVIIAFWHGDLLMQAYNYYQLRKTPDISILISDHFDGKLIAKFAHYFKLGTIFGSSNRSAVKVLIQAMRLLKEGHDIAITPDGPRGPRHEVSDGIVVMAQKTGAKVMLCHCRPSSCWQLSSWDRFSVPKPFGTIDFYVSEPVILSGLEFEEARALIKTRLMEH